MDKLNRIIFVLSLVVIVVISVVLFLPEYQQKMQKTSKYVYTKIDKRLSAVIIKSEVNKRKFKTVGAWHDRDDKEDKIIVILEYEDEILMIEKSSSGEQFELPIVQISKGETNVYVNPVDGLKYHITNNNTLEIWGNMKMIENFDIQANVNELEPKEG